MEPTDVPDSETWPLSGGGRLLQSRAAVGGRVGAVSLLWGYGLKLCPCQLGLDKVFQVTFRFIEGDMSGGTKQ